MTKNVHKVDHPPSVQATSSNAGLTTRARSEGKPETERLADLVSELQAECARLRQSLIEVTAERDLYLKAVYANARQTLHFEGVDITELETVSGGPLQTLE